MSETPILDRLVEEFGGAIPTVDEVPGEFPRALSVWAALEDAGHELITEWKPSFLLPKPTLTEPSPLSPELLDRFRGQLEAAMQQDPRGRIFVSGDTERFFVPTPAYDGEQTEALPHRGAREAAR